MNGFAGGPLLTGGLGPRAPCHPPSLNPALTHRKRWRGVVVPAGSGDVCVDCVELEASGARVAAGGRHGAHVDRLSSERALSIEHQRARRHSQSDRVD